MAATTGVLFAAHAEFGFGLLYAVVAVALAVLAAATYRRSRPAQRLTLVGLGSQVIGAVGAAFELRYGADHTAKARHLHAIGVSCRFALAANLVFSALASAVFVWAIIGKQPGRAGPP